MKNLITFNAKFISFEKEEEEEYYSVGFSEDEFQFENHMFFSRSYSEDEPEYCEINDQAYGGYGICKKAVLFEDKFVVELFVNDEFLEVTMAIVGIEMNDTIIEYLQFILKDKLEIR